MQLAKHSSQATAGRAARAARSAAPAPAPRTLAPARSLGNGAGAALADLEAAHQAYVAATGGEAAAGAAASAPVPAGYEAFATASREEYMTRRHELVLRHFPTALGVDDFVSRVEIALSAHGFRGDNSIGELQWFDGCCGGGRGRAGGVNVLERARRRRCACFGVGERRCASRRRRPLLAALSRVQALNCFAVIPCGVVAAGSTAAANAAGAALQRTHTRARAPLPLLLLCSAAPPPRPNPSVVGSAPPSLQRLPSRGSLPWPPAPAPHPPQQLRAATALDQNLQSLDGGF